MTAEFLVQLLVDLADDVLMARRYTINMVIWLYNVIYIYMYNKVWLRAGSGEVLPPPVSG